MLYKNTTKKNQKVRIKDVRGIWQWKNVEIGQEIDISKVYGKNLGFTAVEKIKEEPKKEEKVKEYVPPEPEAETDKPDVEEDKDFKKELMSINGIGNKTAEDIIKIYPTKSDLIESIKSNDDIPIRDDIEDKLKKIFK